MGRRYTDEEVARMEQEAIRQGMAPEAAQAAAEEAVVADSLLGDFSRGALSSLARTALGLEQGAAYLSGRDTWRADVQRRLAEIESPRTAAEQLGSVVGTAAQFVVPQLAAPRMALPPILRAIVGQPGSIRRGAAIGATYEGTQPIRDLPDLSTDSYTTNKLLQILGGAAVGGLSGAAANYLTRVGVPIPPERRKIVANAERLGIPLTPAQRTGDVTLQQIEEGLAARPGSAKAIWDLREQQKRVLDRKAAEAIGSSAPAPTENVLAERAAKAREAYQVIAQIPMMKPDKTISHALDTFIAAQGKRAIGSPDAAAVAKRVQEALPTYTGDMALQDWQGIRDLATAARRRGDVATAQQLTELSGIMEDWIARHVPKEAMDKLAEARQLYARIHELEAVTDPLTGRVSAARLLSQEARIRKPHTGRAISDPSWADMIAAAQVIRQTVPYIGSSGTAERIAGQQIVEGMGGPFAAIRTAIPVIKNALAAQYYLRAMAEPGMLAARLTPSQNMYVRRLIPAAVIAGTEHP